MGNERHVACEGCFKDQKLIEFIQDEGEIGDCSWCGAKGKKTVPLGELRPVFQDLLEFYEPVDPGDPFGDGDELYWLVSQDWDIFSETLEDRGPLLTAILSATSDPDEFYSLPDFDGDWRERHFGTLDGEWVQRIENIFRGKSGPARGTVSEDRLHLAIEDLQRLLPNGTILYRCRVYKDRSRTARFDPSEMGAPPAKLATPGRANETGIPVLYLASDADTALAEGRSWKGAAATMARVRLLRNVSVLDLLQSPWPDSPFFDEMVVWKVESSILFRRFAEELSQPLLPDDDASLYLPSQYLSKVVRELGYDGIQYPSAMGAGWNLVLFDPTVAEVVDVSHVRVKNLSFVAEEMYEHEVPYPPFPYARERGQGPGI